MDVQLYSWPESQNCIDCPNAVFIDTDDKRIGGSAYICLINLKQQDCPLIKNQNER